MVLSPFNSGTSSNCSGPYVSTGTQAPNLKSRQVVSKELREERAAEMAAEMGDWGRNVYGSRAHVGFSIGGLRKCGVQVVGLRV